MDTSDIMEAGCSSRLAQISLSSLGFLCVFSVINIHAVILVPKQHTRAIDVGTSMEISHVQLRVRFTVL
jgi:hypothetical protein